MLAVTLSFAPTALHAQSRSRWKEIGKTPTGNLVYVDPRTLKTVNGVTTSRLRVLFLTPVATPQGTWRSSQHVAMFDCGRRMVATKENVYYADSVGRKVIRHDVNAKPGFGPPLGGMGEIALEYICRK